MALADWRGGRVAREAKALAPSACQFAGVEGPKDILYQAVLRNSFRCPDPFVELRGLWIVRRLAPDCCRISLESLPAGRDETLLLTSMGFEAANVHLGTRGAARLIVRHLRSLGDGWLEESASHAAGLVTSAWNSWKSFTRNGAAG